LRWVTIIAFALWISHMRDHPSGVISVDDFDPLFTVSDRG